MQASPSSLRLLTFLPVLCLSAPASAQLTFSVDWKGPSIAQLASVTATPITEGDILIGGPGAPGLGPLNTPHAVISGSDLGLNLYTACAGHLPGVPCGIEVDALSRGVDTALTIALGLGQEQERVWFSVDEWARGAPMAVSYATVFSEGQAVADAAADIFMEFSLGLGPIPPSAPIGQHVAVFDGNGLISASPANHVYPGLGMIEPNPAGGPLPNLGDNLDAFDIAQGTDFPPGGYFFSVDAGFVDPNTSIPNTNTAAAQGAVGADVLRVAVAAGVPAIYAPAGLLGLDLVSGPGSDDLDALILAENGVPGFQRSLMPYDWMAGGRDMLLFSVRRGSAVIGRPDSIFGQPIEEGDILTTPLSPANGGVSPFPGIFYAAESLGLATARTHGFLRGDDLDGMDISASTCFDCNNNGVEDAVDIATGSSSDTNDNGIPDECEAIAEYCHCGGGSGPCNNDYEDGGCTNSTGVGSHLYFTGTHSVQADDLVLTAENIPPNQFGLHYMGDGIAQTPFGDGVRCVGSQGLGVFRYPVQNSGGAGVMVEGPGIVAFSCSQFIQAGCISAGQTWYFQCWYRDPNGPCASTFNLSNGIEVQFGM